MCLKGPHRFLSRTGASTNYFFCDRFDAERERRTYISMDGWHQRTWVDGD